MYCTAVLLLDSREWLGEVCHGLHHLQAALQVLGVFQLQSKHIQEGYYSLNRKPVENPRLHKI